MDKMMAIPRYDRKNKIYNVYVNENGNELPIGYEEESRGKLFEYATKEEAVDWISNNSDRLILANNVKEFTSGAVLEAAATEIKNEDEILNDAEMLKKAIQG